MADEQMTNTVPSDSSPQFLDKLKVERERGITVKAQTVSIIHTHTDGNKYLLNLIDTPGHVDFSYEVSRSLGACEGGLLLVDSTQGIQAQTLAVYHAALDADLTVLGVINKIDLRHAEPDKVSETMTSTLGIEKDAHLRISAKNGIGVDEVLKQVVDSLPPPRKWEEEPDKLRALVFDSQYDHYRGVVSLVRIMSGSVRVGDKVRFLQADRKYEVSEIGINNPDEVPVQELREGQVGYLVCNMRSSEEAHVGDTICHDNSIVEPLPGFKAMRSMVFAGVFPTDSADFDKLEEAIERLTLNDRSVTVARETSAALMQGFRLGFLGTLHMDVFRQRLEDEYSSEVIVTAPTVPFRVTKGEKVTVISNPCDFPDEMGGAVVEEPIVHATIIIPIDYIGPMMDLCAKYRSTQLEYKVMDSGRAILRYAFPLSEIVTDFFSALKSTSSGFASFDYEEAGYEESDLVKINILLNGNSVDALSMIVHRSAAQSVGKEWCKKMKEVVPRQMFELAIQAAVGSNIVARESLPAMRKDVTAGLYGGHFERKLKHLNKQKEGKKKLKRLAGNIDVPQSAFFTVLSRSYSTAAAAQWDLDDPVVDIPPPYVPFPPSIPHQDPPRPVVRPLHRPSLSVQTRSQMLAELFSRSESRGTPADIHDAFQALLDSTTSHLLTPEEIEYVVAKMVIAGRREGSELSALHADLNDVLRSLRHLIGDNETEHLTRLQMALIIPLKLNPTQLDDAEQRAAKLKNDAEPGSRTYQHVVHLMLRLCARAGDEARFEKWWNEARQWDADQWAMGPRLSLLANVGKIDEVVPTLQSWADQLPVEHHTKVGGVGGHAMSLLLRHDRIGKAFALYNGLTQSPTFATGQQISFPTVSKTRAIFSIMVSALGQMGHMSFALDVMRQMHDANLTPFVHEYVSLFRGFMRHGEPANQSGSASNLFPMWEVLEVGRMTTERGRMWDGRALESPWTRSALEETFEAFLTLTPGMRGVETSDSRIDASRAPTSEAAYTILFAFARTTGGDAEILRDAWRRMDAKFSGKGWRFWRPEDPGFPVADQEADNKEEWKYWKRDNRLERVLVGLDELHETA